MARLSSSLLIAVLLGGVARGDDLGGRTDRLFAPLDRADTPGCALAVVRDGEGVHRRASGLADLEHGVRITPDTIFHAASFSKQFTAFAVLLLEKDGKLALDDDVRKHLPELHDFSKTVTV